MPHDDGLERLQEAIRKAREHRLSRSTCTCAYCDQAYLFGRHQWDAIEPERHIEVDDTVDGWIVEVTLEED